MMVIKLATTITCFGPSNGHHLVVHLALRVYTICKYRLCLVIFFFYVLLAVDLSIILVINQLNAQTLVL